MSDKTNFNSEKYLTIILCCFFFLFVELLWYKNKKYLNFFSERNWEVHVLSSALPSHLLFSWTTNHQTESRLTPAIIFDSQRWTTATKAHKNDEIYFCLMRIFLQHEMDDINETWEEMGEKWGLFLRLGLESTSQAGSLLRWGHGSIGSKRTT